MSHEPWPYRLLKPFLYPGRRSILPDVEYKTAVKCADERRQKLETVLTDVTDQSYLTREFLEVPESVSGVETRNLSNNIYDACGQTARLKWQFAASDLSNPARNAAGVTLTNCCSRTFQDRGQKNGALEKRDGLLLSNVELTRARVIAST